MREIKIPTCQEEVPEAMKIADEALAQAIQDKLTALSIMRMIQDVCIHPNTYRGSNMGRWPYTKCTVCKKEW